MAKQHLASKDHFDQREAAIYYRAQALAEPAVDKANKANARGFVMAIFGGLGMFFLAGVRELGVLGPLLLAGVLFTIGVVGMSNLAKSRRNQLRGLTRKILDEKFQVDIDNLLDARRTEADWYAGARGVIGSIPREYKTREALFKLAALYQTGRVQTWDALINLYEYNQHLERMEAMQRETLENSREAVRRARNAEDVAYSARMAAAFARSTTYQNQQPSGFNNGPAAGQRAGTFNTGPTTQFGGTQFNNNFGGTRVNNQFGGTNINNNFGGTNVNNQFGGTTTTNNFGGNNFGGVNNPNPMSSPDWRP
jgi:hypothetical protein